MFNKNRTYEQHDNEKISFYRSSVEDLNSQDHLTSDIDTDICIIGGGLTGISSAINLSKKGYSVTLCEARKIGWGASGRNGGQLGIGMRKDQFTIEKKLGLKHAKELWSLGLEAVEDVKNLIKENEIDCHLVNGVMSTACFEKDIDEYQEIQEKQQLSITKKSCSKEIIRKSSQYELQTDFISKSNEDTSAFDSDDCGINHSNNYQLKNKRFVWYDDLCSQDNIHDRFSNKHLFIFLWKLPKFVWFYVPNPIIYWQQHSEK